MSPPEASDRLLGPDIEVDLGTATIGRQIIVVHRTRCTNDDILKLAAPSFEEGLVVFAEEQTAGRGQRSASSS